MSNEEIIQVLEKFKDYLSIGNIFSDPFRWLGWVFVKGLAFILDGIEKVTNDMLLVKQFFQNPEVVAFVDTIRPFLFVLLAFSLLYAGYMLIFQKKFDREGMAINIFIAMIIIMLLGTGMEKTNEFTDEAIKAINTTELYDEGEGSISENVISRNVYDLVEFDRTNWANTELERPNTIPLDMISQISITEKFDSSREELSMTANGKDISKKYIVWTATQKDLAKFDQSGLEWNNEYYYRYSPNWLTLITTLAVMAFTLFSIAYKLARLSFELAFNYILAIIIAPADVHDGQKTKKIIQSILNTFLVIILIFLSMKVYMMGTAYISAELEGLAYLIALIAFSVAVIDGPNIVERLFGIDAGLKSGWGLLAGAYAGTKALGGIGKGLMNMAKEKDGSDSNGKSNANKQSKLGNEKLPSPNDEGEENKSGQGFIGVAGMQANNALGNKENGSDSPGSSVDEVSTDATGGAGSSSGTRGISSELEAQQEARSRTETKAPSPNDAENGSISSQGGAGVLPTTSGSSGVQRATGIQNSTVQTDTDITSVSDNVQGNSSVNSIANGNALSPTTAQPTSSHNTGINQTTSGSSGVQRATGIQNSTVQTDTDITNVSDNVQGNSSVNSINNGNVSAPATAQPTSSHNTGINQTTSGSSSVQRATGIQNSTVQTDTDINNVIDTVQGNTTTTTTTNTGSGSSANPQTPDVTGRTAETKTTSGSQAVETNSIIQNSAILTETEIASTTEQLQGNTTTTAHTNNSETTNNATEHKRPRRYNVDGETSNLIERIKKSKKRK